MKYKKSKKCTSLLLAASIIVGTMPIQTNCGFIDFTSKHKHAFRVVGFYSLALASTFAYFTKNSTNYKTNPPFFYLKNIGGALLGLASLKKAIQNLKVFTNWSKNLKDKNLFSKSYSLITKTRTFFDEGLGKLLETTGAFLGLIFGPSIIEN